MSQSRTSRCSDLAPWGFRWRCLRRLDLLLLTCCSHAAGWLGSLITDWSGWIDSSWSTYPASGNCCLYLAYGPLVLSTPGPKSRFSLFALESYVLALACWSSCGMWHADAPSRCWDVALLLLVQSRKVYKGIRMRFRPH